MSAFEAPLLGKALGLDDLWVLASAYAPRQGAEFLTGTFKETEALGVLSRVSEQSSRVLIISSAGNAARAFLEYGLRTGLPVIVVAPQKAAPMLQVMSKAHGISPLLILLADSVYMDAIRFVDAAVAEFPSELVREGGAFNVARRDAMAVPFLYATRKMGGLPDRYVQAVGSGTGALAASEAAIRLQNDSQISPRQMALHLVQNAPFTPMVDAWERGDRQVVHMAEEQTRTRLQQVAASVLSNASPPYSLKGGVFDALSASGGSMVSVSNDEIYSAQGMADELLGFRPCEAASAALAGLRKAAKSGGVGRRERVLLHLTGGGLDRLYEENRLKPHAPAIVIAPDSPKPAYEAIGRYLNSFESRSM